MPTRTERSSSEWGEIVAGAGVGASGEITRSGVMWPTRERAVAMALSAPRHSGVLRERLSARYRLRLLAPLEVALSGALVSMQLGSGAPRPVRKLAGHRGRRSLRPRGRQRGAESN